jgi:hypothetical protein
VATLCCSPLETPTAAGNPNPDQRVRVRARGEGYPNPNPSALALIVRWQVARHYGIPAASWLDLMTQAGGFQGPAKSALLFDRRTHPSAAGHALAATLLQRCAYNDATELAHADMTTLPKKDTNCTALSDASNNWYIGSNTFAASLRTDICPQRKESSSTSHARNPFNLNFF